MCAAMDAIITEKLLDAARQMAGSRTMDPLLKYAMDVALELTGAEYGYLVLLDVDGKLDFRVNQDKDGREFEQPEEQISHSVFGKAISNHKSLVIADAINDPDFQDEDRALFI